MVDESPIGSESVPAVTTRRASWTRRAFAAVAPALVAFVVESMFPSTLAPWSLFYPAVFLSSWLGGFSSGAAATGLSTVIVWVRFLPPAGAVVKTDPRYVLGALVFVVMGLVVSGLERQVQRSHRDLADALVSSRGMTEKLRKAVEERRVFAALIENSSDLIGIADATGQPIYINPAGRRMLGLSTKSATTPRIPDYYPPELRAFAYDVVLTRTLKDGKWEGETALRNWTTEEAIPVWQKTFMIRDRATGQVLGIGTVTRDISDMKRNRDELMSANARLAATMHDLAESQRLLQAIMDFSPNVIVVKDLSGRYILTNQRIQKLLGVSAAATQGKTDIELFPGDIADRHRQADVTVLERGVPMVYEETIDVDGERHVFMSSEFPLKKADGHIFAVGAIWADITARKRAEEALRDTAADLREAQRVAHLGSWSWDMQTDRWRWSDEVYGIFGRDPARGVPRLFGEHPPLFTPESTAQLKAALAKLRSDAKAYEVELELVRPDGTTRWITARGEPVRDARGHVTGLAGAVQDVTALKELQRLRREWTSVVAHDLRQPIGVIMMGADLLPSLHGGTPNERESALIERMRAAARGLARMVNDLLDVSLMDAKHLRLERHWVDPHDVVKEAIERLTTAVPKSRVVMSEAGSVSSVFVDPMRIGQVLGNLLSNAAKYGERDAEIQLRLDQQDGELEITVTNRGAGIPREELPRLFGKFVRSHRVQRDTPGLGVGLYIAKGIIEAHGGRMWVESTPGKTTAFHFTLPSREEAQQVA